MSRQGIICSLLISCVLKSAFCIINPVIQPEDHHTVHPVLPLRLKLFTNQFDLRRQRALQLIVIQGISIKRVAVSCGYHSVLRFSKLLWDDVHRVSGAIGAGIAKP